MPILAAHRDQVADIQLAALWRHLEATGGLILITRHAIIYYFRLFLNQFRKYFFGVKYKIIFNVKLRYKTF